MKHKVLLLSAILHRNVGKLSQSCRMVVKRATKDADKLQRRGRHPGELPVPIGEAGRFECLLCGVGRVCLQPLSGNSVQHGRLVFKLAACRSCPSLRSLRLRTKACLKLSRQDLKNQCDWFPFALTFSPAPRLLLDFRRGPELQPGRAA